MCDNKIRPGVDVVIPCSSVRVWSKFVVRVEFWRVITLIVPGSLLKIFGVVEHGDD